MAETEISADTDTEMSAETDTDNFRSLVIFEQYNKANKMCIALKPIINRHAIKVIIVFRVSFKIYFVTYNSIGNIIVITTYKYSISHLMWSLLEREKLIRITTW